MRQSKAPCYGRVEIRVDSAQYSDNRSSRPSGRSTARAGFSRFWLISIELFETCGTCKITSASNLA